MLEMTLSIKQIPVGPMQNFSYLVFDSSSTEAIAIDSGWETAPIVRSAETDQMNVRYVIATHGHFDHTETLSVLARELDAKTVAHELSDVDVDLRVRDGNVVRIGAYEAIILHTPGHTEDSICINLDGHAIFTGDTLFIGNCGRTDLPGGSVEKLYHSLRDKIMAIPGGTRIYPGHDYGDVPSRTLDEEAKTNPCLLPRSLSEFADVL